MNTSGNFIDKITEKTSLWENLANTEKPVILYGTGNGADKILDFCAAENIKISGIFASDEFARGQTFRGYAVKKLRDIQAEYGDFCILTAFASKIPEVVERIYELNRRYELYSPNFPVFGGEYPDYNFFLSNSPDLEKAYDLLSDGLSKEIYINSVNFMISGRLKYLHNTENSSNADTGKRAALDLLNLQDSLHYIDAGAYDGDTIFELEDYLENKNISSAKITALEPDKKNFAKLEKNLTSRNLLNKCAAYNLGAWSGEDILYFNAKSGRSSNFIDKTQAHSSSEISEIRVNSIDNITDINNINNINNTADIKISETLIKYDVEGAEYEALLGSSRVIKQYAPKLIVSLYHKNEDIFKLPLFINSLNPGYKFYIRKRRYIPCWDLNLYAVLK